MPPSVLRCGTLFDGTGADPVVGGLLVVDDGRIVAAGTHESLMAESPTYREFAESQSLDAEVGGAR